MSKTFSTDWARQKRIFIRNNRKTSGESDASSECNVYAIVERSFQVDAVRYGNQRKAQAVAKVLQRRRDRRTAKIVTGD
jgi:hypothetical protein